MDLSEPKRQSPVGVAVIFFKNLRVAINIFISIFFVQYGFRFDTSSYFFDIVIGVILISFVLISYLQFRRFFFYVQEDKFVIEKGLIRHDRITIPFDRIQSVHISQNVIQQLLNVVGLKIDTAGSAQKELEIAALGKNYARELQEYLLKRKMEETGEETEISSASPDPSPHFQKTKEPLLKLSTADLFRIGFTENHLRTGLVLFAVVNGYIWQYEEYILKPFEPYLEQSRNVFLTQWVIMLPVAVVLFFVVSVLLSLIQSFLRYYGLKFYVHKGGAQLISGLLKRTEYQIPINKIQYIKWSSNPLRKLIGLKTIVVKQAASAETSDKQSLKVPGSRSEQLNVIINTFYPERDTSEFTSFRANMFLAYQRSLLWGLLPALIMAGAGFWYPFLWYLAPFWLAAAVFFAIKYASSVELQCNREMLMLSKGWAFPDTSVLKYFKLQNIRISQTIFQKRRGLVNLTLHTAAGDLYMPQIDENSGMEIYNYVMYKIESSGEGWM